MKPKILILLFLTLCGTISKAQDLRKIESPCDFCSKEFKARNKQFLRQFDKLPCSDGISHPILLPFVETVHEGSFVKEEFEDYTFLDKLEVYYPAKKRFLRGKKYLHSGPSYIYDSIGKILARPGGSVLMLCDSFTDSLYCKTPQHSLIKIVLEKRISCLFYILGTFSYCYFGIADDKLWVIVNKRFSYEAYTMHDFIDLHWGDFHARRLKYEENPRD
jgi:hypothetical protein